MPIVSETSVRFMRKIQVRDYEPAECEVTFKAALLEGEEAGAVTNALLKTASGEVHEALGLRRDTALPLTATRAVGEKTVRDQFGGVQSREQVSAPVTAAADPKAAAKAAKKAAAAATPPGPSAGDIPDSAPPATTAPAATAPTPAAAASAGDIPDDVPAATPTTAAPATAATPPATQAPAAAAAPAGDANSPAELSRWVGEQVRAGKLTVAAVATVYPQFGVRRLTDLKADQVVAAKAAIEKKIAEHGATEGL